MPGPVLEEAFRDKPARWWLIHLQRHDVPCGPNYDYDGVCSDPRIRHRNMIAERETPWGKLKLTSMPWKFSRTPIDDIEATVYPDSDKGEILENL